MNTISNEALQKLKCDYGNHYLSQFPVYLTSDNKNVCGRCKIESQNCQRNLLYETLAVFLEFPCMFTEQGCTEVALPNKIEEHELNCSFRSRKCPIDGVIECKWHGIELEIVRHCQATHSDLMLENPEFIVELSTSFKKVQLISMGSFIYTLNLKYYSITKLLELSLMKINVVAEENDEDYRKCQIVLKTDSRDLTINYDFEQTGTIEILVDSVKDSKDVTKLFGKVVFNKENKPVDRVLKVDYEMLEHFKCTVCKKYSLPPYSSNDKSVIRCGNCVFGQHAIDFGLLKFETEEKTIYDLVDKIAENTVFSCINGNGCTFASFPNEMKTHLISCRYITCTCPVSTNCNWNNFGFLLAHHIKVNHENEIMQSTIITEQLTSSLSKTYLHNFANRVFKIYFFENAQKYYWDVQEIGTSNTEFYFNIQIKNNVTRLSCDAVCDGIIPMTHIKGRKKVCVTKDQLQDFIVGNKITFEFSIYKN